MTVAEAIRLLGQWEDMRRVKAQLAALRTAETDRQETGTPTRREPPGRAISTPNDLTMHGEVTNEQRGLSTLW